MNYWHIQLHPSDQSTVDRKRVLDIIQNHKVIGMGDGWDNDRGQPTKFREDVQKGDIVLIRSQGSPLAIVEIAGPCITNSNSEIWFSIVRKVKIIAIDESGNIKNEYKRITGKNWSEGIYAPTTFEGANNYKFLKYWYYKVIKENIMANIKLSDRRKEELINLWNEFNTSIGDNDINWGGNSTNSKRTIDEVVQVQLDNWKVYRDKIAAGNLSLQDYTSRKEGEETVPGHYLCNFLERTTRHTFGSSKPGNANNFMVKLNEDMETYTIRQDLKHGESENKNELAVANEYYESKIKHLIENIVNTDDVTAKILNAENNTYAAKQLLRKMVVLEYPYEFLNIYSDQVIDQLHKEFLDSDTDLNLMKNHEIRIALNNLFEIENNNRNNFLLSRFMWQYANTRGVADENSPNVILYGPPGTGKTFTVKESLNFICKGDRSRYEFVQFHPSFSYEDFIEGIKPKGVVDGNVKFELVDGVFKKFCKKARKELIAAKAEGRQALEYYFVVDEINRANLSSVFGETLFAIEKGYRDNGVDSTNLIKTQYSSLVEDMIKDQGEEDLAYHFEKEQAYFGVPKNLYFIGMMNDVDKSIDAFDLALRRRFKWIRMDCDYDVIEENVKNERGDDFEESSFKEYLIACRKLNNYISQDLGLGKSYEFGHSFFMKISSIAGLSKIKKSHVNQLFELHLQPTLKEYLRAMYPESELPGKIEEAKNKFKSPLSK